MIKEIKYLFFTIIIVVFILLTGKYYFSDSNKKKSYRLLSNINKKINLYSKNIPVLINDTQDIIEYVKNTKSKNKRKYSFWELIDKND
jgi:hypothetical protein